MGFALELALDDPADLEPFICSICQELYSDPVHLGCPDDHVYCASCLADHIKSTSNVARTVQCPLCRARVRADHSRPGLFIRRQLDRLRVRCSASDCSWTGRLGDNHHQECEKQITSCTYTDAASGDRCDWRGPIPALGEHDAVCPLKPVACPREGCTASLCRRDLDSHESVCTYFRCSFFTLDGCPFRGRRHERETHQTYCTRLHVRLGRQEATSAEENRLRLLAEERLAQLQAQVDGLVQKLASEEIEEDLESQGTVGEEDIELDTAEDPAHLPYDLPTSEAPSDRHSSPTTSTRDSSPQRSSSAPPPPRPFQLTVAKPIRPASPNLAPPPAPLPRPSGPFNLTSVAPSAPLVRPPAAIPPPLPPTSVSGPFSLTRRPLASSTSASAPRVGKPARTGALFDLGVGRGATEGADDEEEDLGRWETGGAKRPRFDGGFPREWAQGDED